MGALELRLPYRTVKARPFPGLAVGLSLLPSLTAALLVFGPPPWRGEVGVLVGLTLLAHLLAFFATDRMARYPGREAWGLAAFNLLLFTLLLLAVLALGRGLPPPGSRLGPPPPPGGAPPGPGSLGGVPGGGPGLPRVQRE